MSLEMFKKAILVSMAAVAGCAAPQSPGPSAGTSRPEVDLPPSLVDCRGVHRDDATDSIQCPGFGLWVNRSNVADIEANLDRYVEANVFDVSPTESREDYEIAVKPYELPLGTEQARGRHYQVRPKALETLSDEGFIVMLGRPGKETLAVVCEDRGGLESHDSAKLESDCREAMSFILTRGLPQELFTTAKKVSDHVALGTFAGRTLAVPEGCDNRYPQTPFIDCGAGGKLSWTEQQRSPDPLAKVYQEAIDGITRGAQRMGQALGPKEVPCLIDEVSATCAEQVIVLPTDEPPVFVYHGLARVRDIDLLVVCSWQRGGGDRWPPPPCDQVLDFPVPDKLAGATKECEGGDAEACFELGMEYMKADGFATQPLRGERFLEKGCDGGAVVACSRLGNHLMSQRGKARNTELGIQMLTRGCEGGDAEGCSLLGYSYVAGVGVTKDVERAVELLEKGCNGGMADGCSRLGSLYAIGEQVERDPKRAVGYFKKACDQDDLTACTNLGLAFITGDGVAKDAKKAVKLYRKACDAGDPAGCATLGSAYGQGEGVKKDLARARKLFGQACEAGDAWACGMKEKPDDYWIARSELERSCNMGSAKSCFELGLKWGNGEGGPADIGKARQWVKTACTKGHKEACDFLPMMAGSE